MLQNKEEIVDQIYVENVRTVYGACFTSPERCTYVGCVWTSLSKKNTLPIRKRTIGAPVGIYLRHRNERRNCDINCAQMYKPTQMRYEEFHHHGHFNKTVKQFRGACFIL